MGGAFEVEESLLKDGPTKAPVARIPLSVFVYGLLAAIANGLFGFETSVISVAKLYFAEEFNISSTSAAYGAIAASLSIGATVGSFFAGWPQDRFGRRVTLVVACAVYIGAVAISFTAGSFAQLFVGRLITGVSVGIFSSTVPMYISELAPPSVRGKLVTVNQVCIVLGILGGFLVGKALSPSWRWMLGCGVPLAGLLTAAFIFITPYSPRWLVTKGRSDEARRVLLRIRGGNGLANKPDEEREAVEEAVEAELRAIEDTVASTDAASKRELLNQPWVRWAIVVGIVLAWMQQFTGVNAVNAYAPDILKDAGFNAADSITQSIYIGVVKLAFVIVALALMDRLGRRDLLLGGTAIMAVSLGCLAAALMLHAPPMFTAGSLFIFMGAFEMSLGPVMWLLLSELYPLSVRGTAMAIGSTACWIFTVAISISFPSLSGAMGTANVFWLFFAICVVSFVWMLRYVPETKGKTLEQIETMLSEGRTR